MLVYIIKVGSYLDDVINSRVLLTTTNVDKCNIVAKLLHSLHHIRLSVDIKSSDLSTVPLELNVREFAILRLIKGSQKFILIFFSKDYGFIATQGYASLKAVFSYYAAR